MLQAAWILTVANAVGSDDVGEIRLVLIANQAQSAIPMILPSQYKDKLNARCLCSTIRGLTAPQIHRVYLETG